MVEIGDRYRASDLADMGYGPVNGGFIGGYANHQLGEKLITKQNGKMFEVIGIEKI